MELMWIWRHYPGHSGVKWDSGQRRESSHRAGGINWISISGAGLLGFSVSWCSDDEDHLDGADEMVRWNTIAVSKDANTNDKNNLPFKRYNYISVFCLDQNYDYIFLFKMKTFATVKKKRHCYKMMRCVSVWRYEITPPAPWDFTPVLRSWLPSHHTSHHTRIRVICWWSHTSNTINTTLYGPVESIISLCVDTNMYLLSVELSLTEIPPHNMYISNFHYP